MLGVPKGNTGFKHLITPTAETYSPSACTKAGVYHTGSLSSMSISSSSSSALTPNYATLPTNALRPSHRAAGVKPSSTKSFFWHKPKPISLGYKHNCKIPLHWWNYSFFCKLKITYLSNQKHSLNIFVLSALKVPFSQILHLECFIGSKSPHIPPASPLLILILWTQQES